MFGLLGIVPGPDISLPAAAALTGQPTGQARAVLQKLENASLIQQHKPGRYRMHDLVRQYAAENARHRLHERDAALTRLLRHYATCAPPPRDLIDTSAETIDIELAGLRAERENLLACIDYAYRAGWHSDALRLSNVIHPVLLRDGPWDVAVAVQTRARDLASQLEDRHGQASALNNLGQQLWMGGHLAEGLTALTEALAVNTQVGDLHGQADTLIELGALNRGHAEAKAIYAKALDLYTRVGDLHGQAKAHVALGLRWLEAGRYAEAEAANAKALDLYTQIGDLHGQARALINLGGVLMKTGRHPEAESTFTKGLKLARQLGRWQDQVYALSELGRLRQMAGDVAGANAFLREARQVREQGHLENTDSSN